MLVGLLVAAWLSVPDVSGLARALPSTTRLIEQRTEEAAASGRRLQPRLSPVPLDRISDHLLDAVVLSEDASFFQHDGFDWREVKAAVARDLEAGRFVRGASTITMQLAKNLYLGTEKSLGRKVREALITMELERKLSKARILTLYLNVVELGDGVFGVEAGARQHFGVSAAELSPAQAAVLAALLPAPRAAGPSSPSPRLVRSSRHILSLMRAERRLDEGEYREAKEELERLLARAGARPRKAR